MGDAEMTPNEVTKMTPPLRAFISYSHVDKTFRDRLEVALSLLKRQGLIEAWSDVRLTPGSEIEPRIFAEMRDADLIILLVSQDFLASDYCYEKELSFSLERHASGRARVLPIIVRPSDWLASPIARLLALPDDGKAISTWTNEDAAWLAVSKGIRSVSEDLGRSRSKQVQISKPTMMNEAIKIAFGRLQVLYEGKPGPLGGIPQTGISALDNILCGFEEGEFDLLADFRTS